MLIWSLENSDGTSNLIEVHDDNASKIKCEVDFKNKQLYQPFFTNQYETVIDGGLGGSCEINLENGNVYTKDITEETTFSFTNPGPSGKCESFTLIIYNGGDYSITWPISLGWLDDIIPTLTPGGTDILSFFSLNGGINWTGFLCGQNMTFA